MLPMWTGAVGGGTPHVAHRKDDVALVFRRDPQVGEHRLLRCLERERQNAFGVDHENRRLHPWSEMELLDFGGEPTQMIATDPCQTRPHLGSALFRLVQKIVAIEAAARSSTCVGRIPR